MEALAHLYSKPDVLLFIDGDGSHSRRLDRAAANVPPASSMLRRSSLVGAKTRSVMDFLSLLDIFHSL
jgi:hypothetical protein